MAAKTLMLAIEPPASDHSSLDQHSKSAPNESAVGVEGNAMYYEGPLTYAAEWERDVIQVAKTTTMLVALLLLKLCFDLICETYLPHRSLLVSDTFIHIKESISHIGTQICGQSEQCWGLTGVLLPLTLTGLTLIPLNHCLPAEIKFTTIPLLILLIYMYGKLSTYF